MNRELSYFRTLNTPLLLFILSMALVSVGIMGVYAASSRAELAMSRLADHLRYATAGLALMLVFYNIDYNKLKKFAPYMMLGSLVLLVLVYVPGIGVVRNYSHRWIGIAGKTIQPSEFAKLAMIIYMAKMMDDRRQYMRSFCSGVMPALIVTGLFALIIVREPDLGAALVLCMIIFGMWLAGEMRWFHLIMLVATGLLAVVMGLLFKRDYHQERTSVFLTYLFNPEAIDKSLLQDQFYQTHQSLIAVGSGGWWGLGLGESQQKFGHLPEAHTDYIFAILSEEMGFVRMSFIVFAYAAIVLIGWRTAMRSTDYFGGLIASGITLMIFINSAINMGVVMGLLPAKGLTLPLVSFGGTALLVTMAAMGILMNVASTQYAHQNHGLGGSG